MTIKQYPSTPLDKVVWVMLLGMILLWSLLIDGFLTSQNIVNILAQASVLGIMVVGQSFILITGNFDLSMESTLGLAALVGVWLAATDASVASVLAVPALLLVGILIGRLNGFLITRFKMPSFIVTLATLIIFQGFMFTVTDSEALKPPSWFMGLGYDTIGEVPLPVIVLAIVFIIAHIVMHYRPFGRDLYAIGNKQETTSASGAEPDQRIRQVYILSGILAAFAGWMLVGRVGVATWWLGRGIIFQVLAAAAIGGISLFGGRGTMIGALGGVLLLTTVNYGLTLMGASSTWPLYIIPGLLILLALFFDVRKGQFLLQNSINEGVKKSERPSGVFQNSEKQLVSDRNEQEGSKMTTRFHAIDDYQGVQEISYRDYQKPTVHCYKCHNTNVTSVCHHCGRAMCRDHEAHPRYYQSSSREFVPLLKGNLWKAAHCEDHQHHIFSPLKVLTALGIAVIVLGLLFLMPLIALPVALALILVGGVIQWMMFSRSEKTELAAIPLVAENLIVRVDETVRVKLAIQEDGQPYQEILSKTGELSIGLNVGKTALEALDSYHAKCKKYGWVAKGFFDLGYLGVNRPSGLVLQDRDNILGPAANVFHLVAEEFNVRELVESGAWRKFWNISYDLDQTILQFGDESTTERFLFWLRPTLEPLSGGRKLRFELDIAGTTANCATLKNLILRIDRGSFPDTEVGLPVEETNGRWYPEQSEVRWLDKSFEDLYLAPPYITFRRPISEMEKPLKAEFEVTLDTTISGLDVQQSHIWLTNGHPITGLDKKVVVKRSTQFIGEVVIDPSLFSYQFEVTTLASFEKKGVALQPSTVKKILETLESEQVYVKSVIENTPVNETRSGKTDKRCLDILGRYYAHIYPVDVHVFLVGTETKGTNEAEESTVSGELALRALINSQARDTEQVVTAKSEDLQTVLTDVL